MKIFTWIAFRARDAFVALCGALLFAVVALAPIGEARADLKSSGVPIVDPDTAVGIWRGQYVCKQGLTGLTLVITDDDPEIVGVFVFYESPANPGVPQGCFEVAGEWDDDARRLRLRAGRWIHRPKNYITVDLEGLIHPRTGIYYGQVLGAKGCTNFEAFHVDEISSDRHVCYARSQPRANGPR